MPCMCYYEPSEESKKIVKESCMKIIEEIKECEKIGDPLGLTLSDIHILLDHLYDPSKCKQEK
mgnify:FL=1